MDPDVALAKARAAFAEYEDATSAEQEADAGGDLAEAFNALDEWLTKGGYIPKAWALPTTEGVRMR